MTAVQTSKQIANLLAAGFSSDLAGKVVTSGYTLSRLKTVPRQELSRKFSSLEVNFIWEAVKRAPISEETVQRLVEECDWKCCICWDFRKESPVIIHHIEEHSKTRDDSYENLVILCLEHHAQAHSKWEISRSPCPPELIRQRKKEWIAALVDYKAGRRPAPGYEPPLPLSVQPTAPLPPLYFAGRQHHCQTLVESLVAGHHVALQGMGGIGKTATAQKVAAELSAHFSGGIFWGSLTNYSGNCGPILRNWLYASGHTLPGDLDANGLSDYLRGLFTAIQEEKGAVLVVIDDVRLEWLNAARLLKNTMPTNGSLLITTRDSALAAALGTESCYLGEMSPLEALDLLKAHAGPHVIDSNPDTVARLLKVVGYLPLAVELAGKRLAFLSHKHGDPVVSLYQVVSKFDCTCKPASAT
jgi:hypothetical protein